MYKAFAMLRTVFLVFIIGYTLWAVPWNVGGLPSSSAQAYDICRANLTHVVLAVEIAIAWIAFETIVGWLLVRFGRGRKTSTPAAAPSATPPTTRP